MSANDAGFKAIRDSYRFFLNTNFTHYYDPSGGTWLTPGLAEGPKSPTIDEFAQVLPFEEYDRTFLDAILPSQPARDVATAELDPAYLPGKVGSGSNTASGAYWLSDSLTAAPTDLLGIAESTALKSQEQFNLKRLAVVVGFEKLQSLVNRLKAGASIGPDAQAELLRAGRALVLRELSRMAINGDGSTNNNLINGLHILYNNTFGATGTR